MVPLEGERPREPGSANVVACRQQDPESCLPTIMSTAGAPNISDTPRLGMTVDYMTIDYTYVGSGDARRAYPVVPRR